MGRGLNHSLYIVPVVLVAAVHVSELVPCPWSALSHLSQSSAVRRTSSYNSG